MESFETALARYYAGDFLRMEENNPDLAMVFPKEGTNIFVDSICIPKGAQNKAAAELYINFLLEPDIALENAEYLCYASPNTTVLENEEYSLKDDEIVYPSAEVKANTTYFHNLPQDTLEYMTNKWDALKIGGSNSLVIYISLIAVVLVVIAVFVLRAVKKKKQSSYMD